MPRQTLRPTATMPVSDPSIVFHAGFHKTGTTSLQTALHRHATALSPVFAIQTRSSSPRLLTAADAARDCSADPGPHTRRALTDSLTDWATHLALAPGQGLMVSCEDFAGHIPGRPGVADYRAALVVLPAVRDALRRHLPRHPLSFLFTTRDAAAWLRAIHWQLSRHDDMTQGPNRFARSFAAAADFASLLRRLRALMPDVTIGDADLADLAPRRLGPVEAIYDAANLPQTLRDTLPAPPHVNRTPPHNLARVFVKLNRSDLPRPEIRRLKREMLAAEHILLGDSEEGSTPTAQICPRATPPVQAKS